MPTQEETRKIIAQGVLRHLRANPGIEEEKERVRRQQETEKGTGGSSRTPTQKNGDKKTHGNGQQTK